MLGPAEGELPDYILSRLLGPDRAAPSRKGFT